MLQREVIYNVWVKLEILFLLLEPMDKNPDLILLLDLLCVIDDATFGK